MRASTARVAMLIAAWLVFASGGAAAALFPQPLHITRRIDDPIARNTVTIEEYCSADRIVSVRGDRTVIIDYASGQLTEIDRSGTYSITSFEELANAQRMHSAAAARVAPQLRATGTRVAALGHALTVFATSDGVRTIQIAIDDQLRLSRGAIEALIGAAYPNRRNETHDAILAAAQSGTVRAAAGETGQTSGLPVSVDVTVESGGESLTLKNEIVAVDSRTVPAEALLIPPGAMRVESRLLRLAREADALDHPKGAQH